MPPSERPIHLDHNATTPLLPEVVDAMLPYLREQFGNPSSSHPWGRRARAAVDAVDAAREQVSSPSSTPTTRPEPSSRSAKSQHSLARGAGHERGLRPGTENVASIVGLGVACAIASTTLEQRARHLSKLRDRLWAHLAAGIEGLKKNGHDTEQLPNTLSVRFPRVRGTVLLDAAPKIAASTGSACHEGHERASDVILATGLSANDALETVRLSVGVTTTIEEVESAASARVRAWSSLASAGGTP